MKRKIIISVLTILLITTSVCYAQVQEPDDNCRINALRDNPTKQEVIQNNRRNAEKEKELQEFLKFKKDKNIKMFDNVSTRSCTTYETYVPVCSQITGYVCGAATAEQVIYNWHNSSQWSYQAEEVPSSTKNSWWLKSCALDGNLSNTSTSNWKHYGSTEHTCYSTYTHKQCTLMDDASITYDGATITGVKNAINKYVHHPYHDYYSAIAIKNDTASKSLLKSKAMFDFYNDHAVVYNVKTDALSRYGGRTCYHFISGYSLLDYGDYDSDKLRIVDPHYDSSIGGRYTEPFNNVYTALANHYSQFGCNNMIW